MANERSRSAQYKHSFFCQNSTWVELSSWSLRQRGNRHRIPGTAPSHALSGVHTLPPIVVIRESGLTIIELELELRIVSKRSGIDNIVYLQIHYACLSFVSVHQMSPPPTEMTDIQFITGVKFLVLCFYLTIGYFCANLWPVTERVRIRNHLYPLVF